jgi:hypothetical protein
MIDMDQAITVHEVPTGAEPEGVFLSEDGSPALRDVRGGLTSSIWSTPKAGMCCRMWWSDTRPRRFAATPDRKELWVTAELSGEVYIIDRGQVRSLRQDRVPAARHAQDRRDAGRPGHDQGWLHGLVTLGHAAHVAVVDVPTRRIQAYILVGKRSWGISCRATSARFMWPTALAMTSR